MPWSRPLARWSVRLTPLATAAAVLVVSLRWQGFTHPDLVIQRDAARLLLSRSWAQTYLAVPEAQMGPLSLVLVELPRQGYITLTSLLVVPFLILGAPRSGSSARRILWCLACVGLVVPWSQFAWKGHVDDALVLCCAAAGVRAWEHGRRWWAVTACVVGMAAKPTAILLAPVLDLEGIAAAAAAAALLWAPFAWADPAQFLRAGRGIMHIAPQSLWGRIGVARGAPPGWLRPSQLVLGLGLAFWVRTRRHVSVALLAAFTVRSLMEMNPAPAYAASIVALALHADSREPRPVPVFTTLALAAFWTSQPALDGATGWPRIIAHVALLALTIKAAVRPREAAAIQDRPAARAPAELVPPGSHVQLGFGNGSPSTSIAAGSGLQGAEPADRRIKTGP